MLLDSFLEERLKLEKTDITLKISSFDDVIFSRSDQFENEWGLKLHHEDDGRFIMYYLGLPYIIDTYYKGKGFPKDILSQMNPDYDCIISSWLEAVQKAKLEAIDLSHISYTVVKEKSDKILASIRYVLYTLRFIPKEIIIYEDNPKFFIQYKKLIEGVLWCQLTIMQVEMDGNKEYKAIKKV